MPCPVPSCPIISCMTHLLFSSASFRAGNEPDKHGPARIDLVLHNDIKVMFFELYTVLPKFLRIDCLGRYDSQQRHQQGQQHRRTASRQHRSVDLHHSVSVLNVTLSLALFLLRQLLWLLLFCLLCFGRQAMLSVGLLPFLTALLALTVVYRYLDFGSRQARRECGVRNLAQATQDPRLIKNFELAM